MKSRNEEEEKWEGEKWKKEENEKYAYNYYEETSNNENILMMKK